MSEFVVEVEGLSKHFPGVLALDAASLSVRTGEVHGLVGENGAGKSTLIKILAGAQRRDAGVIRVDGVAVEIASERAADSLGLHFIHQDVGLVPRLTVTENVFLGHRMPSVGPFVSKRRARQQAEDILAGFADVDPSRTVASLSVAERWMVAIARACAGEARLVVMDEPTVALADAEVERVFAAVARLQSQGIAVLFVSHRLGEVLTIAQRVTVMKDGRTVGAHDITDLDRASLVGHIIGREAGVIEPFDHLAEPHEDVALEARALSGGPLREVDVKVRAGEVLGIGGLVGSGRTSLLLTLFGHHRPASGSILIGEREVQLRSPADAIRHGLALLPEERRDQGLLAGRGVRENIVLAHLPRLPTLEADPLTEPDRRGQPHGGGDRSPAHRHHGSGTADRDALRW